jgi:microcystin-dependent protein
VSFELSSIVELATNFSRQTIDLSPSSLAVLTYAQTYLNERENWLDHRDPFDTVSDEEWDEIEALVSNAYRELFTPMLGHILAYVTAFPPANVLPCDGSQYLRTDYPTLYDVLAPAFIVDADNFIVPDLRGRTIIGVGQGVGLANRAENEIAGTETTALSVSQLPVHSHTNSPHGHSDTGHIHSEIASLPVVVFEGVVPIPGGASVAFPSSTGIGFAGITASQVTIDNTGSNEAHANMPPFVALNYGLVTR